MAAFKATKCKVTHSQGCDVWMHVFYSALLLPVGLFSDTKNMFDRFHCHLFQQNK